MFYLWTWEEDKENYNKKREKYYNKEIFVGHVKINWRSCKK
jgi:hypothetical protein